MTIRRSVVFWALKTRPSWIMRGQQIAQELAQRGWHTDARTGLAPLALRNLRNSIIVCIKSIPICSSWLKQRGNLIVYDAIDYSTMRGLPSAADAIITSSKDMEKRIKLVVNQATTVTTIYHHADPFLKPHEAGDDVLKLVYVGEPESSSFVDGEISELQHIDFKRCHNWRDELRHFNALFSARRSINKAVIKLANASALGAVFLTGAEPGCVELLGNNYPFYLSDPNNLSAVRTDILRLKSSVGTPLWYQARDLIVSLRPLLSLTNTATSYESLFHSLEK